jgi:hypothetical protein
MRRLAPVFVALTSAVGLLQLAARAADDEMAKNPPYTHWSAFKPGTTVTQRERVLFTKGTEEADYHGHTGGARIVDSIYKLLEVTPNHVVVQLTLVEHGHGSTTEHAPTKITFHAMAPKSRPAESRTDVEKFTEGDEEVKVLHKTVKAHFVDYVTPTATRCSSASSGSRTRSRAASSRRSRRRRKVTRSSRRRSPTC